MVHRFFNQAALVLFATITLYAAKQTTTKEQLRIKRQRARTRLRNLSLNKTNESEFGIM